MIKWLNILIGIIMIIILMLVFSSSNTASILKADWTTYSTDLSKITANEKLLSGLQSEFSKLRSSNNSLKLNLTACKRTLADVKQAACDAQVSVLINAAAVATYNQWFNAIKNTQDTWCYSYLCGGFCCGHHTAFLPASYADSTAKEIAYRLTRARIDPSYAIRGVDAPYGLQIGNYYPSTSDWSTFQSGYIVNAPPHGNFVFYDANGNFYFFWNNTYQTGNINAHVTKLAQIVDRGISSNTGNLIKCTL